MTNHGLPRIQIWMKAKQMEFNRIRNYGPMQNAAALKNSEYEVIKAMACLIPSTHRPCASCDHYRRGEMDAAGMHLCERPQLDIMRDRVAGADVPKTSDAYRERADNVAGAIGEDRCGPEGKFWQRSGF